MVATDSRYDKHRHTHRIAASTHRRRPRHISRSNICPPTITPSLSHTRRCSLTKTVEILIVRFTRENMKMSSSRHTGFSNTSDFLSDLLLWPYLTGGELDDLAVKVHFFYFKNCTMV